VWLELPVQFHRPLPPEGVIRQVLVVYQEVADKPRWRVQFVVECAPPAPRTAGPRVALDLGWRRLPDGTVRAGMLLDDQSQVPRELLLPPRVEGALAKVEDLRSIRDQQRDTLRALLGAWCDQQPALPDWLREARAAWADRHDPRLWRAPLHHWRPHRFPADEEGLALLGAWWQREAHLWQYEAHLRDQALAGRQYAYRAQAARALADARELVLERFDLRAVARRRGAGRERPAEQRPAQRLR